MNDCVFYEVQNGSVFGSVFSHSRSGESEQLGGHVSFGIRQYILLPKFINLLPSSEIPGQYKHVSAFQMTALRKENRV